MTGRVPQVLITLSAEGQLQAELPASNGQRRIIGLKPDSALASIRRMLQAQLESKTEIGQDGAPTKAQLRHWEDHEVWADPRCRFCLSEGRTSGAGNARSSNRIYKRPDGVEVKRIKPKASGLKPPKAAQTTKLAKDLGL